MSNINKIIQLITLEYILSIPRGYTLLYKTSKVGRSPRIFGKCKFNNNGNCIIGNNISIRSNDFPVSISVRENAELIIGNDVFLNAGVDIGCTKKITIGNNVLIGGYTNIIDNNYHYVDMDTPNVSKPVIILDNVWVGNHCLILPGVSIGKNSVIGSGSVVTKDIPENVLAAGNPAVVKKKLNIPEGWIRKSQLSP